MLCGFRVKLGYRVWRIQNDFALDPSDLALRDVTERAHSVQFVRDRDRNAFVKSRARLRRLLGHTVGAVRESLKFNENAWGRPVLRAPSAAATVFNVPDVVPSLTFKLATSGAFLG